jgi:hypothetical protein
MHLLIENYKATFKNLHFRKIIGFLDKNYKKIVFAY